MNNTTTLEEIAEYTTLVEEVVETNNIGETILETSILEVEQPEVGYILLEEAIPGPSGPGVSSDLNPTLAGNLNLGAFNIHGELENEQLVIDGGLLG